LACLEALQVHAPEAIASDILERQIETAAPVLVSTVAIAMPALRERAIADAAPELF
jgi:hypothetical protein